MSHLFDSVQSNTLPPLLMLLKPIYLFCFHGTYPCLKLSFHLSICFIVYLLTMRMHTLWTSRSYLSHLPFCWMSGWMNEWVKSIRVLSLEALCNLFFFFLKVIASQILFSYDQVSSIIIITLLSGWLGVFISILCWWHHQLALLTFVRCLPVHCSLMETSEMKVDLCLQTKGAKI